MAKKGERDYTPELKAEVLALLKGGAPVKRLAREKGIPESTVRWWRDNPDSAAPAQLRVDMEQNIADQMDLLRRLYITRAGQPDAIRGTSGWYAVRAAAELTTAIQLLTGKPTQRIEASPWGQLLKEIRDGRSSLRVIDGGKAANA